MLTELPNLNNLFRLLFNINSDIATEKKKELCPLCGAPLHQANYPRNPAGGPQDLPDDYKIRFSLCCSRDGCRKRVTPTSVRFMGRKEHWSCVILIVITLKQNRTSGYTAEKLMRMFNISHSTLYRWAKYFRDFFPNSSLWKALRGNVRSDVYNNSLPGSLLQFFINKYVFEHIGLIKCLKFLASDALFSF